MEKGITYSGYQQAVFDYIEHRDGSLIINAVAGSGKTFTIVNALRLCNGKKVLFLAFNKKIVEELASRLKAMGLDHIVVKTFHSLGMSFVTARDRGVRVDSDKVKKIIRNTLGDRAQSLYFSWLTKMVSLAKQSGVGCLVPNDAATWSSIAEHYDVTLDSAEADEAEAIQWGMKVLDISNKDRQVMDFDDMIYWPALFNLTTKHQYDMVFVDESQDTNKIQISLLRKVLKPNGRLVAVGDPYQAIYGFRGADSSAMDNIAEAFDCEELPLSISYRCSKAAGELAKEFVPHFEVNEPNREGQVADLDIQAEENLRLFAKDSAILCRNTAPLIGMAYWLLRKKIPCKVLGREIGQGLVALVRKLAGKRVTTIEELEAKLEEFRQREVQKLMGKFKESQAQVVDDKCISLMFFIDNLEEDNRTINGLITEIENLFRDGNGCLTLSTIHKAKGLEWNRVFILNRHLMPCRWARKPWQREQERNLQYVAYTRTKNELFFIQYDGKGK